MEKFPHTDQNTPVLWRHCYPWPTLDGHKYQRGHALIVGGLAMTGASRLTARAALRVGAGIVTLAVPQTVWPVYAASLTSVIVRAFDKLTDLQILLQDAAFNVFAMGPGAGVTEETRQAVLTALSSQCAVVLDADALTVFAQEPQTLFQAIKSPCVLTPHQGEFARIFSCTGDKLQRACAAAAESGAVIVLKGNETIIADPAGYVIINSNAPADLATAGSGDVLTGLITGLLAQGMPAFYAAAAAVWLHGEAAAVFGPGLIADDLVECLPAVLRGLKKQPG